MVTPRMSGRLSRAAHRRKELILTQAQPSKVRRTAEAVVTKDRGLFLLCDDRGDVPPGEEHGLGLYLDDCRFLDVYELRIDGERPTPLSSFSGRGYGSTYYLATPEIGLARGHVRVPKDAVAIKRERVLLGGCLYEVIGVTDHAEEDVSFKLELVFGSAFSDVFVIRGFVEDRGAVRRPRLHGRGGLVLRYRGIDDLERTTTIALAPRPQRLTAGSATFDIALRPGETKKIALTITPREQRPEREHAEERETKPEFSADDLAEVAADAEREWVSGFASVSSGNPLFDRVMRRSLLDLRLLRGERFGEQFIAAGIPWFSTLFGRDACIVGLQTLPFGPVVAAETLRLLARFQARDRDPFRDAEPGKILHELRSGELANAGVIPQSPAYYGSVDATLLWMILLGQYVNWTGDLAIARELHENLVAAVAWSVGPGDSDGDGYIDYRGGYERGLVNQGWKDSGNAIVNADGSLAEPPVALVEVQAYAYRAWRSAARIFFSLGERERCEDLTRRADALRRRFDRDFWSDELGCYVLARQDRGSPCAVVTSNAGQVLWGGIALRGRAHRVARRMLEDDMFSGWGIRTLSSEATAYNPISYHLGSVWPHDNSLILGGLRRYGHDREAGRIFTALFEAAASFREERMPELYCGYARQAGESSPVAYPVACSPQAWGAGTIPYALWQMLGLRARAAERRVLIDRPRLPEWLPWLEIHGLTVGDTAVDIRFDRGPDGDCDVRVTGGGKGLEVTKT